MRIVLPLILALAAAPAFADEPAAPPADDSAAQPPKRDPLAAPTRDKTAPIPTTDEDVYYALGARARYLSVPGFMLSPFLQQYTTLNSGSFAIEGIRRKGTLDIVLSLDFGFYSPPDGNYLGSGKDPALDTHYTHFDGLNFLSLDVSFYWVHDLASWLAIMIGGGVGIGIVFGDIYVINNGSPGCATDPGNTKVCYPLGTNGTNDPNFQHEIEQIHSSKDTAGNPNYHASTDKPPVMVVVNFIVGFKFKLHRHFNVNVSGGFRDGFVVGAGPEYVF